MIIRSPILASAFAFLLAGTAAAAAEPARDPVERGKAVYAEKRCSMCHAIEGKGNAKTPLDGVGSRLTAEQIRTYIVSPRKVKADSKMKAYPDLPQEDLDALVAYLGTLKTQ